MTASAYAELLAIRHARDENGHPLAEMMPGDTAMGRPSAMHGGAVASLLEQAGRSIAAETAASDEATLTLVSLTVDYLRAAPMRACRARGTIVKAGGRVVNVAAEAWADDPAKPFAAARLTFLVTR